MSLISDFEWMWGHGLSPSLSCGLLPFFENGNDDAFHLVIASLGWHVALKAFSTINSRFCYYHNVVLFYFILFYYVSGFFKKVMSDVGIKNKSFLNFTFSPTSPILNVFCQATSLLPRVSVASVS